MMDRLRNLLIEATLWTLSILWAFFAGFLHGVMP